MRSKSLFFIPLSALLLGCYTAAVGAPNPATKDYVNSTLLGRQAQGGVVFFTYLSGNVVHGLIAAAADEPGTYTQSAAVNQCLNKTENGYSDWVLPNKAQMTALFVNRFSINPAHFNGGFATTPAYWTSSMDGSNGWNQSFAAGTQNSVTNFAVLNVRCVRTF